VRTQPSESGGRGSNKVWLDAAYENLIESGIDSVRIVTLSERLNLSRTSFYWFFRHRGALLQALLERWQSKNSRNLIRQAQAYADTITEAILNVFDCWLDSSLFDSKFEFAVRNWAHQSPKVAEAIASADNQRLDALKSMFVLFGYEPLAADVRARTIYLTQIGYISMQASESLATRMSRIPSYCEIFTSKPPTQRELDRFFARHGFTRGTDRKKRSVSEAR
jgi:AcrR family transcriptional regulator